MGKVLNVATVASNLNQFDRENLKILKDLGYDIHIACNFNQGNSWSEDALYSFRDFLGNLEAESFDVDFSRNITDFSALRRAYKTLLQIVTENSYDFIHCHTPVASAICRMVAKKTGVKVIYTAHGFHFFKGAPLKYNLIFKNVEKHLAKYTDMLITMNQEDLHAAESFRLRKGGSVKYIPGIGLDVDAIKNRAVDRNEKRKEIDVPADATVIITVAELIVRKNYPAAIEAFAKSADKNSYYVICGTGPLENELKNLAESLGVGDRIRFLGYRSDIYELLKASDIFLFTSTQEGLPVAVMEAMASRLPCVISDIRGSNELVVDSKGGFVIDCKDIDAFSQKVGLLIQNTALRNEMGEYNQIKINEFNREKVNILMRENYLELQKSVETEK